MSKVKQIIRLRNNGTALQTIAKGVGISRNTVKKYVKLIEVRGYDYQELLKKGDEQLEELLADPDQQSDERYEALVSIFPYIEKELKRTGVNRWVLWGEYKQQHPGGYSYAHFCRYLRQWTSTRGATMHFEHRPGDKLFIDFAGKKLQWVDRSNGEIHEAEVYIAILGYSQLTYAQVLPSQKKEDFIGAIENALHYFGGEPQVLVPDNLKSAVNKASKYEADINTDFADFARRRPQSLQYQRASCPQL